MRSYHFVSLSLLIGSALLFCTLSYAQDSSSKDTLPVPKATPSASPEVRKSRPSPEREQAMSRGQQLLFKEHNPKASIEEFKRATRIDPWYGQGYMLLGLAQMQIRHWADAQFAFEEAAKVEPGNAKAYLGIGSALNEQQNYAEAQKALEHSLELAPESPEAQYELGRTLAATGKWEQAAPHVQRAIALNPDYAGPHALMGNIYVQREQPEPALKEFQEFLRLDPQSSMAPAVKNMIAQLKKTLEQ
jgi:tetratricopeptide (TPR) repeat protein